MRAAMFDAPGELRIADLPAPTPATGELLVRVGACGICGTDLHIADGEFPPTPYPIVPGHEFAGTVADVGPDAPGGWQPGDRVAVDPSLFCGWCRFCRAGRGNLCANWAAIGDTVNGAFAEYVTVPALNAYRLPAGLTAREGALVEPLSCAVHGLRKIGIEPGESVLIVGAGTMGLLLQQLFAHAGASRVVVVDRNADRLAVAADLGADATTSSFDDLADERFDVAVDVTGAAPAIEAAFDLLERGGRLLVFGVAAAAARAALSPFRIYNDEITVVGSMAVLHSFGRAIELLASGMVQTKPLLTHAFPIEEMAAALDAARHGTGVKVQIVFDEEVSQ
jgi:2-desacetyl-2-hydroxyethyl bacteriochlorophyllide A dehydrogenase